MIFFWQQNVREKNGMLPPPRSRLTQRTVERVSQSALVIDTRDGIAGFNAVRAHLLSWLRFKVGHDLPEAMARGETDEIDQIDALRTETVGLTNPLFWSFRRNDHDPEFPQRNWVTEGSIAFSDGKLQIGYRLNIVNRGDPAPFQRSIPRFMRDIARSFIMRLDGVEVELTSFPVNFEEEVDDLIELINSPQRTVPIIAVSTFDNNNEQDRQLLNADRLALLTFGTAHVRTLSWQAALMLTERIGKRRSVYRGAVRLWLAGQTFSDADPYDHPLYLADRILDDGADRVQRNIVNEVLRISAGRRDAEQIAPSFTEVRRAASAFGREQALLAGRSAEELLPLYETDNQRLSELVDEIRAEQNELLDLASEYLKEAQNERDEARAEIANLNARLSALYAATRTRSQMPKIFIPEDFEDIEAWTNEHLGTDVRVLPRAIRAARKSPFENPSLAYQSLLLLKDIYVPMRRSGSESGRQNWEIGLQQLGLALSPTFSGGGAGQFGDEYFVDWHGSRKQLEMHLKGSNSRDPRYGFRLYFFWCNDHNCVVVGSFPNHLTNNAS